MKYYVLILTLLIMNGLHAQQYHPEDLSKSYTTEDIAVLEKRAQSSIIHARMKAAVPSNFDVKYYRGEWEVDPAVNYIKGKLTTHYVLTSDATSISFDLVNNHTVSQVMQRTTPLAFTHTNDVLEITFPTTVSPGTLDSVSITYEGTPPSSGMGSFIVSTHGSPATPVMWTLSEPFGSRDWWPCKNGMDDKADNGIDIMVTHPNTYSASANGLLMSEAAVAGNKTRTHWKHTYPIASYLVAFSVTNFVRMNHSVALGAVNLPVLTYCYPESQTAFTSGTQNALDALQFYGSLIGTYPFVNERYGHTQFGWNGGMEHQTNSFMFNLDETLVAHELAHQWFGDKVTCGDWEDIWLNEGFATHMASVYKENKYPATIITTRKNEIAYITSSAGGSVKVDDVTNVNRIFNNRLSYTKGSHLLYMLRWIMGDANFFQGLRNYLSDPALAYKFAKTPQLRAHLEAVGGKDLTYFFTQWYEGQGYPSYQMEWSESGGTVQYKLNQTTSHASVSFFQLPVPILFRNKTTGQEKRVVANHTASGQMFSESLGFTPDSVSIDPDYWLISRNNTITKSLTPLPVILAEMRATCEENHTRVSWTTTMESNADYFAIEYSSNGKNWQLAGRENATGNSSDIQKYSYLDQNHRGGYYRIAQYDRDGSKVYTRILASPCASINTSSFTIVPNPVQHELRIESWGLYGNVFYKIYDLMGRQISNGSIVIYGSNNHVSTSNLSAGIYILSLTAPDGREIGNSKFIKR